ncbi:MAG: hypothetical protein G01um101419_334 [Parcubacteria group bacterium Gr01-1014_19]|nr:MAG: hypothetical protein G01um101419_334 [Parcubacteria group bacterium Gr01-1014_19]
MFDILPEIGLVLGAVLVVCGMFFFTNVGLKKSSQMVAHPVVVGSKAWTERWEKVARRAGGQMIPSEVPPEIQLEASVITDDLRARRDTEHTRKFFRDMTKALKENAIRDAAEREIQRRIRREENRHKIRVGRTAKIASCKYGKREATLVGIDKRGRGIFQPIGRKCRIRRDFALAEAA